MIHREISRVIFKGDIDAFDEIVRQGYNIHSITEKEHWNLLHRALVSVTLKPKIEMINHLIECRVNVNGIDVYGYTPLHYAARTKNLKIIALLLNSGAEIDLVENEGSTPLKLTFQKKPYNLDVVRLLLSRGANMNHSINGGLSIYELVKIICHKEQEFQIVDLFDTYKKESN